MASTTRYYPAHAGSWQTYVADHGTNPITCLLAAGYIYDNAHEFVSDITGEITTGSVTRVAMTGVTCTPTGDRLIGRADDFEFPTCTFTGATSLVWFVDTGSDATSTLIRCTTFAPTNVTAEPFPVGLNGGVLFDYNPADAEISSVAGVTPGTDGDIDGADLAVALGLIPAPDSGSVAFSLLVGDEDYTGNAFTTFDVLDAEFNVAATSDRADLGAASVRVLVGAGADICKVFDITATEAVEVTHLLGGQVADASQIGTATGVEMQATNTDGVGGLCDPTLPGTALVWKNPPADLIRPRVIFSRLHFGDGVVEDIDPGTLALNLATDPTDWTWTDPDGNSVAATNAPIIDGIAYRGGTILVFGQPSNDENGPWVPIYDTGTDTWSVERPTLINGVVPPEAIAEGMAFWVGSGERFNNTVWTPSWSGTIAPGSGTLNPEYVSINHFTGGTAATDGQVLVRDDASDRGYKWDTVAGGSGSVATDTIFDAKGDLAVGTGSNTAAKLTVGANDTMLMAASGEATGAKWAAPSDVRTALGLGGSALLAVGTTAGTVAAGDDSRITGAAAKANNLSDLASASTARTNLGLAIGTDVQAYRAFLANFDFGTMQVPVLGPATTNGTWVVSTSGGNGVHMVNSSQASGDYIQWDRIASGTGTYTLGVVYQQGAVCGQVQFSIDGSNVGTGTIEMYAASTTVARDVTTITGVSLTAGLHNIRATCSAKNGSSSAYAMRFFAVILYRTA